MITANQENAEPFLDIIEIVEAEQKLRANMAVHIRSLFIEPRSSEFHLNVSTNEEAYAIASQIKQFSTPEGKCAAEHFSEMIYLFLGIGDSINPPKPIDVLDDLEFIKTHEMDNPQVIWIRFRGDNDFLVYTHTISGFSSEDMSLKEIALFHDIISDLTERD